MGAIWGVQGCRPADSAAATARISAALEDYGAERPGWTRGSLAFGARSWPGHAEASVVADEDAGIALVADVRLDDRDALCDALGVAPAARAATADTELLLRAYKRWSEGCAARLTGDYVFVVQDQRKCALYCFRSALGQRPFYYALEGGVFAFATAVGAVLAAPGISGALDEGVIAAQFLRPYQGDVPERTWFQAVRRLRPGQALEIRTGAVRTFRHWRPEAVPVQRLGDPDAYAEALRERIVRAVGDRMRGGPVATHLSGGLDSSAVTVLAARQCRAAGRPPVPTFTWLPSPPAPLPASYAPTYSRIWSVSEQEGLRLSYANLCAADVEALFRRDGAYPEGREFPVADVTYRQMREHGARVLLTGCLGDEFASSTGFWHYPSLLESGRWLRLLACARSEGASVLKIAARGAALDLAGVRKSLKRRLWESTRQVNLTNPEFRRRAELPPRPKVPWFGGVRDRQLRFLRDEKYALTFEGGTAAAALHGLECRHPLADRRVVEFALSVPPELFRRHGRSRWLMRQAMRSVLPEDVRINRDKSDGALRGPELVQPMVEALPVLRQRLAVAEPSRTRYLHVAKVLAGIDAAIRNGTPPDLRFNRALMFLCR